MIINTELKGLKEATRNLNRRLKQVKNYTEKGVTDVVLDCLGKSVPRAPVDTGDLRGSGFARVNNTTVASGPGRGSTALSVKEAAGAAAGDKVEGVTGFSAPYAVVQHEDLSFNHPKGGEAKYLERTVVENTEKWINHLRKSAKKGLE